MKSILKVYRPLPKWLPYLALISFGLIMVAIFLRQEWRLTGRLDGVPLDDSWIHYRFASNLRDGSGFAFNPGEPTAGSTSPLWVLLLSLVGFGYLVPSKLIGIIAYLCIGIMVYLLGEITGLDKKLALLTGISTLAAGRLAWAAPSGMETTAFSFVSLLCLWLWSRNPPNEIAPSTSLVFGLAGTLRPEGYLLLGLSGLSWIVGRDGKRFSRRRLFLLARHFLIAGMLIAPYFVFSFLTSGHVLPNTFYSKRSAFGCRPGLGYFSWAAGIFLLDNPVLTIAAMAGILWMIRSKGWERQNMLLLAGAWLIGLPLVYGILAPCVSGYYSRYTTPLIPVLMLFGGLGLQKWLTAVHAGSKITSRREKWKGFSALLMTEGVLLSLIPTLLFWSPFYGQSVFDIENLQVRTGYWLEDHTSPEDLLALNDIGAIGTLSNREVIDLMGLTNPEVLPLVDGKGPGQWDEPLAGYLAHRQPDYLVIFPHWYPTIQELLPLSPVFETSLPPRSIAGIPGITVAGGERLVVYKIDWARYAGIQPLAEYNKSKN